jgi:hypothetical protein
MVIKQPSLLMRVSARADGWREPLSKGKTRKPSSLTITVGFNQGQALVKFSSNTP